MAATLFVVKVADRNNGVKQADKQTFSQNIKVVEENELKRYIASGNIGGLIQQHKSNILITNNSELLELENDTYKLSNGSAVFHVEKEKGGQISVECTAGQIKTKGTIFHVTTLPLLGDAILIAVLQSQIEFVNDNIKETVSEHEMMLVNKTAVLYKGKFEDLGNIANAVKSNNKNNTGSDEQLNKTDQSDTKQIAKEVAAVLTDGKADDKSSKLVHELINTDWKNIHKSVGDLFEIIGNFNPEKDDPKELEKLTKDIDIGQFMGLVGNMVAFQSKGWPAELIYTMFAIGDIQKSGLPSNEKTKLIGELSENMRSVISSKRSFESNLAKKIFYHDYISKLLEQYSLDQELIGYFKGGRLKIRIDTKGKEKQSITDYFKKTLQFTDQQVVSISNNIDNLLLNLSNSKEQISAYHHLTDFINSIAHMLTPEQKKKIENDDMLIYTIESLAAK
ncbi:MAG: hypothetical protein HY606_01135 [Planctomycetes bacterium]|nr:hypothetical protein [Planctomycetota bacterium]